MNDLKLTDQDCKDLIEHCIKHMCSPDTLESIYGKKYSSVKKYVEHIDSLYNNGATPSCVLQQIKTQLRSNWRPSNKELHIHILKSGKLLGHSWHKTRPSTLHLSIQEKVRCIENENEIDSYLEEGKDIFKQEYFIVAQHDLCESTIIEHFEKEVIPPNKKKSITDFIYNNIPYDLKVTTFPSEWTKATDNLSPTDKETLAKDLYGKADSERIRKQAESTKHNWGLNRLYVVIQDPDRWMTCPEKLLDELIQKIAKERPFSITITPEPNKKNSRKNSEDKYDIKCFLVIL